MAKPKWDTPAFRAALDGHFGGASKKQGKGKLAVLLVLSLLLFVGGEAFMADTAGTKGEGIGSAVDLEWIGILVGTLLFHELGHLAAMRFFGYQDLGIFFIPFFGAAATGQKKGASPVQRAWVLLAGPLPGILVGSALLPMVYAGSSDRIAAVCWLLLFINLFNLVPGGPLDGGRFMNLVLFSRKPKARAVAQFLGVLVLGSLAWAFNSPLLAMIALFTLRAIPDLTKSFVAGQRIREVLGDEAVTTTRPSEDDLPIVAEIVIKEFSRENHDVSTEPGGLARRIFTSWVEADYHPPSWKASIGLLAVYVAAWLIAPLVLVVTALVHG